MKSWTRPSAAQVDLKRRAERVMEAWSKSLPLKERLFLEAMETPEQKVRRVTRCARRIAKQRAKATIEPSG
jgi:hypothetical protein